MLELTFAERTSPGLVRANNEDAQGHVIGSTQAQRQALGWFFCLADGMGAHASGEIASQLAVETACDSFLKGPKGVMHVSLLPRIVQQANNAVYDKGHEKSERNTMGTTIVCCALRFDSAVISHVGDSRCYLLRNRKLSQLTHDHTMHNEHVRLGIVASEDAGSGDGRNILTRALGLELFVAADTITVNVMPGDVLLLCSDGLHGYVSGHDIEAILLSSKDIDSAAEELIAATLRAGAPDNVSVTLLHIRSVERMGLYRGRPYRLL